MLWKIKEDNAYNLLPMEVNSHIKYFYANKQLWEKMGTTPFYRKLLSPSSTEGKRVLSLFHEKLDGNQISVTEIYSVVNPTLLQNFLSTMRIMEGRASNRLFHHCRWRLESTPEKEIVYEAFNECVAKFSWNSNLKVPILPTVHGTDAPVAWQICSTGFAALSSLDAGFYGRGIYFTTHAIYASPYIVEKKTPALIISFVIPGNIYPVTEAHDDTKGSLLGTPIKTGYQSHYVLTNESGGIFSMPGGNPKKQRKSRGDGHLQKKSPVYDEIVIAQESQILPSFVLYVDGAKMKKRVGR
eukprot:TRINITY_DN11794_c0_g1_i3.p1 TRINITY_DN11794_c0_g1~~TRINITY_DN11794_c0_g1_i3.p1  ORF type:complete len:298 (-),score=75.34 TRINITY_DN11794_c0_g1_i3:228-1121(-)